MYLDRATIDAVNRTGVDINLSIGDPYHSHLLQYISGMGPRKAASVVSRVMTSGGGLDVREDLVEKNIVGPVIYANAASFLKLGADCEDPLDNTRIHPKDYDLARKMAADALDINEADLDDLDFPSQYVSQLIDEDPERINDLELDDFATELERVHKVPKTAGA